MTDKQVFKLIVSTDSKSDSPIEIQYNNINFPPAKLYAALGEFFKSEKGLAILLSTAIESSKAPSAP